MVASCGIPVVFLFLFNIFSLHQGDMRYVTAGLLRTFAFIRRLSTSFRVSGPCAIVTINSSSNYCTIGRAVNWPTNYECYR